VGKVLLAAMPRERALGLLRRTGLPRRTDQTITELGAFARELDTVLNHGWAADEEEQEVGVRCLAVPIGHGEDAVAAISLSGPAERFNGGREPGLVGAMGRVAQRFADELLGP
jgi:IclR family acetate operon transcriptional repressor